MAISQQVLDLYPDLPDTAPNGASLDWAWLAGHKSEWGIHPKPSARGLTMMDIAVGTYGDIPEHPVHRAMAARGADIDDETPDMGYILNRKSDVWASNVTELYEEAVARQWSATRDIPWGDLQELPSDIEHAICQLCTTLSEIEMIASDLPAKWMWRMNHEFLEAKMFLCTQIMDEARHSEVFRKRALANGGGLLMSRAGTETLLRTIIEAKTYTQATALLHLLGEGFILDLFRQGEAIAPTEVEKRIFRMTMQDEARHVAYGTLHIRHAVEADPDVADEIHEALDHGEGAMVALGRSPDLSTAVALLLAGGADKVEEVGFPLQRRLSANQFTSYLARCERAGISRLEKTKLPLEELGIDIEQIRAGAGLKAPAATAAGGGA
ncbi:MAG: ferritin-like domain-containing protein [Actinomycetia bacterium]|nr:ferritin-like domain-containing protein [Actinomycetes bacterium]MCP5032425.1 ferritin-like domain-containing protein [Actinomycetes bacterium]